MRDRRARPRARSRATSRSCRPRTSRGSSSASGSRRARSASARASSSAASAAGTSSSSAASAPRRASRSTASPTSRTRPGPISSTRIRTALAAGDVTARTRSSGAPYAMDGIIAKGDRMGRKIGFPTMNLQPGNELYPKDGVYFTTVRIESFERTFACVTNIGRRPTVYEDYATTIESFILDFSSDVYGERVRLSFFERVREEMTVPVDARAHRPDPPRRRGDARSTSRRTPSRERRDDPPRRGGGVSPSSRRAGRTGARRPSSRARSRRSPSSAPPRAAFPEPAEAAASPAGSPSSSRSATRPRVPVDHGGGARAPRRFAAARRRGRRARGRARRCPARAPFVLAVRSRSSPSPACGAESCRAGGEAGWREGFARTLGVAVPAALGGGPLGRARSPRGARRRWAVAGSLVAAVLVWVPAVLAESARVKAELAEEVRLGLLPARGRRGAALPVDARPREALRTGGRAARVREERAPPRGRAPPAAPPDGARPERLRQLEVLTFRTRLRRTQDAREARFQRSESGEFAGRRRRRTRRPPSRTAARRRPRASSRRASRGSAGCAPRRRRPRRCRSPGSKRSRAASRASSRVTAPMRSRHVVNSSSGSPCRSRVISSWTTPPGVSRGIGNEPRR